MIKVLCYAPLDANSRQEWPTELTIEPRIGHKVMSSTGNEMYIVAICHCSGHIQLRLSKEMGDV